MEFQGAPSLADGMGYTACSPQSEVTRWGEASLGPASDRPKPVGQTFSTARRPPPSWAWRVRPAEPSMRSQTTARAWPCGSRKIGGREPVRALGAPRESAPTRGAWGTGRIFGSSRIATAVSRQSCSPSGKVSRVLRTRPFWLHEPSLARLYGVVQRRSGRGGSATPHGCPPRGWRGGHSGSTAQCCRSCLFVLA